MTLVVFAVTVGCAPLRASKGDGDINA